MVKGIQKDINDRELWVQAREHYFARRYCLEGRNPTFPWVGSPYSRDTEILTRYGWRRVDEVRVGDLVLTRNDQTKQSEWAPIEALPSAYHETLIEFESQAVNLRVSHSHTMVYENGDGKVLRCEARRESGLTGHRIPLTSVWHGTFSTDRIDGFDAIDFCEFLGWYVSEGWTFKSGTIGIAQSSTANPEKCLRIEALLTRMGLPWSRTKSCQQYLVSCKKFSHWMRKTLADLGGARQKHLPEFVFDLQATHLAALLEGLMAGDGHTKMRPNRNKPVRTYYTSSKRLADEVQILAQMLAMRATIRSRTRKPSTLRGRPIVGGIQYEVAILNDSSCKFTNLKRREIEYGDVAFCVTVKNHAVYVRRDGKACWCGNSNIVLPLIDKKIDELKPQYVNIIAAARPPVTVHAIQPDYQSKAKNVELWFDWLVHHASPNFVEETILGVDDCLETGRAIIKDYWHYETRPAPSCLKAERLPPRLRQLVVVKDAQQADLQFARAGGPGSGMAVMTPPQFNALRDQIKAIVQEEFDLDPEESADKKAIEDILDWLKGGAKGELYFNSRDVVVNVPAIRAISPIDFIVPENATTDIEDMERMTEVMYFTPQQLRNLAADQKLNKGAVDELLARRSKGKVDDDRGGTTGVNNQKRIMEIRQDNREGLSGDGAEDLIEVWRTSSWMTVEGGRDRKVVIMLPRDNRDLPLQFKAYNRPSGKWNYHSYSFELNKRRWYSPRGIPEKLDDLEAQMTATERAKLNRNAIVTAPTLKYKPNRLINPATWKFIPGQMFPTNDPHNDVVPLEMQNIDLVFDSEIEKLRTWSEDYIGGPDYGLAESGSMSEPRTAEEIRAIGSKARMSLSMRGLQMQLCYKKIWGEFFDLWHSVGPETVYVRVTGGDEPIKLTKEELQGKFFFQCTGTIGTSDPQYEAQRAQARLIILAQLKPLAEPQYEINLGEAIADWLEKDDLRLMKRVVRKRSPEELQQIEQQMQQAAAQQQAQEVALAATGQSAKSTSSKSKPPQNTSPKIPALPGGGNR